jgi:hypothetical protein
MAKLTRVTAKVFGENASLTVGSSGIGQFGSAKAGTFNITGDVATIQALPAWSTGFRDAVTASSRFPALEEMTGLAKVLSYQNAYVLQEGISEWDAGTTYNIGSIVKVLDESNKVLLYQSIINDNLNTPVTNDTAWEKVELGGGSSRNIGEIVTSTIPLTDVGLHLLDGALIQGNGIYSAFVAYIAGLVSAYPDLFDTEANWQTAVTQYGVCGKFVYDSVNNTVRLPKYGSQIFTKSASGTVPVIGNGKTLGLTNGTASGALITNSSGAWVDSTGIGNVSTSTSHGTLINGHLGVTTDGTNSGLVADISSIKNYPLDCYYYIVIATSTKTQIQVDIDEIATDLNGKMDTDGTNAVSSVKFADSQWVTSYFAIAINITQKASDGGVDYSLSSYLPNDNYKYEVLFSGFGEGSTTSSGLYLYLITDTIGSVTDIIAGSSYNGAQIIRAKGTAYGAGCVVLPVGSARKVTAYCSNVNNGAYYLLALGYRRIGTNQ